MKTKNIFNKSFLCCVIISFSFFCGSLRAVESPIYTEKEMMRCKAVVYGSIESIRTLSTKDSIKKMRAKVRVLHNFKEAASDDGKTSPSFVVIEYQSLIVGANRVLADEIFYNFDKKDFALVFLKDYKSPALIEGIIGRKPETLIKSLDRRIKYLRRVSLKRLRAIEVTKEQKSAQIKLYEYIKKYFQRVDKRLDVLKPE